MRAEAGLVSVVMRRLGKSRVRAGSMILLVESMNLEDVSMLVRCPCNLGVV